MSRNLHTSLDLDENHEPKTLNILVAGWRIQVDVSTISGFGVCVANVEVEGDEAGWCACAFDPDLPLKDIGDLNLSGVETA